MAFDDLRELLEEQVLPLPIGGITYSVPACSADDWLYLNTQARVIESMIRAGAMDAEIKGEGEEDPEIFMRRCLGDAFDLMTADGVTGKELTIAAFTAFFWQLGNEELAERVWLNGGKVMQGAAELRKTLAPNRAARRATSSPSRTPPATAASPKAKTTRASSRRTA
jgi:hypothetical protein